jgi:cell division septum initiation protein DivIVA
MAYFQDDDETSTTPHDRFGDVLRLLDAAANVKNVTAGLKKLKKLESDIAAASETLARLQQQAAGILEAAKFEAARIISAAEEETREARADLEHRESMLRYGERYARKFEAAKARSPNGVVSAFDERKIREELAEEDHSYNRRVNKARFEVMDHDRPAGGGTVPVETVGGGTLTRTWRGEARQ